MIKIVKMKTVNNVKEKTIVVIILMKCHMKTIRKMHEK